MEPTALIEQPFRGELDPSRRLKRPKFYRGKHMPRGGRRDGAGRKPVFSNRKALPVYMEEKDLQAMRAFVEFYKELQGEKQISTSNIMYELGRMWLTRVREEHGDQYLEWAGENMARLKECYPHEAKRVTKTKRPKRNGEKTWTQTENGSSSSGP